MNWDAGLIEVDGILRPVHNSDGTLIHPGEEGLREFWRWFGMSGTLDDQGRPLRFYHGTAGHFSAFDPSFVGSRHMDLEVGEVYYFAGDRKSAEWYARDAAKTSGLPPRVLQVYLLMGKPLDIDFQGTGIETLADDIRKAKRMKRDGLIARNYDDGGIANHYLVFKPAQIRISNFWVLPAPRAKVQVGRRAP